MLLKDYIVLIISFVALGVSLYNFYVQQFRKKERLIGAMISIGISKGKWDTKIEYSVSNVGDVQMVVKELELSSNGRILDSEISGLPIILKPGEVALIDLFYKSSDMEENSTEIVEFGIFSAIGKGYRLPHKHAVKGKRVENMWDVFELTNKHEGF